MNSFVLAVSRSSQHTFSKENQMSINLIENIGVEGDAHAGEKVKHRYLVKIDPTKPNMRQVHLIHAELLDMLNANGFSVNPGQLGENITTRGIDLLDLPTGTALHIGPTVIIELTGLRNPCHQIDDFQKGMLKAVLDKDEEGKLIRKAGVMGIVVSGGVIHPDDVIVVELPPEPHQRLEYTE
ncbi:MAG: MOSC domain-containing protein [Anaerolineae bacterium]|nr:MOSC domain-containing protein [Anaerolineae bacterium]MCA9892075.1 MOSC domain-containing protein [Anaerolineae bacterium]